MTSARAAVRWEPGPPVPVTTERLPRGRFPRSPTRIPSHRHYQESAGLRACPAPPTLWGVSTLDPPRSSDTALAIGFDLDLTLADTRSGIAAVYSALAAETGVPIDTDQVVRRIGPPLEVELGYWFPEDEVPAMAARYREIYAGIAIPATVLMPGAA